MSSLNNVADTKASVNKKITLLHYLVTTLKSKVCIVCVCACGRACAGVHARVCVMCACACVRVHVCVSIYALGHVCMHVGACMHVCAHVCLHEYVYVCVHI